MKMNQPGTDKGERHESGEREPRGATASDKSGERSAKIKNGIGMGESDKVGVMGGKGRDGMGSIERGEFNSGRSESECYSHKRVAHEQDR